MLWQRSCLPACHVNLKTNFISCQTHAHWNIKKHLALVKGWLSTPALQPSHNMLTTWIHYLLVWFYSLQINIQLLYVIFSNMKLYIKSLLCNVCNSRSIKHNHMTLKHYQPSLTNYIKREKVHKLSAKWVSKLCKHKSYQWILYTVMDPLI